MRILNSQLAYHLKYFRETSFLLGCDFWAPPGRPIIHVNMNKAASQFFKPNLGAIAKDLGYVVINYHDLFFNTNHEYIDKIEKIELVTKKIPINKKCFYSSFGSPPNFPIDKADWLIVIRDPRDILISNFKSRRYSHAVPVGEKSKEFLVLRKQALSQNLSEFIYSNSSALKRVCEKISKFCKTASYSNQKVHILRYEDLYENVDNVVAVINELFGGEFGNTIKNVQSDLLKNFDHIKVNNRSHVTLSGNRQYLQLDEDLQCYIKKEFLEFLEEFYS